MAWVHRAGLSEHCVWNRPGSSLLLSEGFQLSKMSVAHTLEKMKETLSTAMELKAKGASPAVAERMSRWRESRLALPFEPHCETGMRDISVALEDRCNRGRREFQWPLRYRLSLNPIHCIESGS